MSSITYNGHDFSAYAAAELLGPAAHAVEPRVAEVPGRPGALLLGGEVGPRKLTVRLWLDAGADLDVAGLAEARRAMAAWLLAPAGAELMVPGEPGMTWRDAVVTDVEGWGSLLLMFTRNWSEWSPVFEHRDH